MLHLILESTLLQTVKQLNNQMILVGYRVTEGSLTPWYRRTSLSVFSTLLKLNILFSLN